jgi:1,4-dihydroxy-2-naphthoyl-CoA hydrolase
MSIWNAEIGIDDLNAQGGDALNETLGIEITEITPHSVKGRMPVDHRTIQPAGVLHGGASVAFAETLASWAGHLAIDRTRFHAVGQEINANHVRPASAGTWVYGEATAANIGRRSHVWDIRITNGAGKLVCVSRCTLAIIDVPSKYAESGQRE